MEKKEKERMLLLQYLPRDMMVSLFWCVFVAAWAILAFVDVKDLLMTHFRLEWSMCDQLLSIVVLLSYFAWGLPFHTWRRFVGIILDLATGTPEISCQLPYQFGGCRRKHSLFGEKRIYNSITPYFGLGPREKPTKWKNYVVHFQDPWIKWYVDQRICNENELYGEIQEAADKGRKYSITYLKHSRMIVDIISGTEKKWSIDNIDIF